MKRLRNLGYSLLATALRTDAGAQPPGFTAHTHTGGSEETESAFSHQSEIQHVCSIGFQVPSGDNKGSLLWPITPSKTLPQTVKEVCLVQKCFCASLIQPEKAVLPALPALEPSHAKEARKMPTCISNKKSVRCCLNNEVGL